LKVKVIEHHQRHGKPAPRMCYAHHQEVTLRNPAYRDGRKVLFPVIAKRNSGRVAAKLLPGE
jgi:hypothetical protein